MLEEQNQRVANNPGARLGEQVAAALYLNHPYGRPVIGWRHEIEKLNREDALAFYRRFYTPNNAILVVAGDVTADEVKALAEETYGKVEPRAEIGPRVRPQEPAHGRVAPGHARRSARRRSRACSAAISCRRLRTAKPGEAEALDVLAHILGSGTDQPALPHAGGREASSRSAPAPGTRARRSTRRASASTARRSPA